MSVSCALFRLLSYLFNSSSPPNPDTLKPEMENAAQNLNPTNSELGGSVYQTPTPPSYITGGCLCGKVSYRAEIGNKYDWPPGVCLIFSSSALLNLIRPPTFVVSSLTHSKAAYMLLYALPQTHRGTIRALLDFHLCTARLAESTAERTRAGQYICRQSSDTLDES